MSIAEAVPPAVAAQPALVDARGVRVTLGDQPVLRGVSLAVRRGQSVALVGPNGAGKSTLLRTLAGLIRPAAGEVRIDGQALTPSSVEARRVIGLVGHQPMLYPEMTARENLRFYGRLYDLDDLDERIEGGLARFGLVRQRDLSVSAMSRGMVQRLTLIRAMLHEPRLLLLDEPDAGLDVRAAEALMAAIREQRAEGAVVFASHDLHRVHELADVVLYLIGGRVTETVATADMTVSGLQGRYAEVLARRHNRPGALGPAASLR